MAFTDYTDCDSVRGVLGVSVKELSDNVVSGNVYLTTLLEALLKLSTTLAADYLAAKVVSPRSVKQARFVLLADTFCAYTVAQALIPTLGAAAPQRITDGKAEHERINNPYEDLRPSIVASLSYFGTTLMQAYADLNSAITAPTVTRRTNVINVGLGVNPVTG